MAEIRHLENREIAKSQRKIIRFWWHLVHNSTFGTWWQSRDQIWFFFKFKMADGRHTETRFLAITLQPDCPISVNYCVGKQFFDRISAMGRITDVPQNVYFVFLTKFGLRRTAAFVSSPVCAMQAIQTGETYCHCQAVLTECISTIFAARNNTGGRKLEQYPDVQTLRCWTVAVSTL